MKITVAVPVTKLGAELQVGDVLPQGRIEEIRTVTVWYGCIFSVRCNSRTLPICFHPSEKVVLACCEGASRDCLVHGDGN